MKNATKKWSTASNKQKAVAIVKGTWVLLMYTTQAMAAGVALYILGALYFLTFPPV